MSVCFWKKDGWNGDWICKAPAPFGANLSIIPGTIVSVVGICPFTPYFEIPGICDKQEFNSIWFTNYFEKIKT